MENAEARLTTTELAARWKRSAASLRQDRVRGRGPKYIKIGHGERAPVRYRLSDIEAYEVECAPVEVGS